MLAKVFGFGLARGAGVGGCGLGVRNDDVGRAIYHEPQPLFADEKR